MAYVAFRFCVIIFIFLGRQPQGRSHAFVNIMITMLLGGLWHGAAWAFVVGRVARFISIVITDG